MQPDYQRILKDCFGVKMPQTSFQAMRTPVMPDGSTVPSGAPGRMASQPAPGITAEARAVADQARETGKCPACYGQLSADGVCEECGWTVGGPVTKRAALTIDPAFTTPAIAKARADLHALLAKIFRSQSVRAADRARSILRAREESFKALPPEALAKANDLETDAVSTADTIFDSLKALFNELPGEAETPLEAAGSEGVKRGAAQLDFHDEGAIASANKGAVKYAQSRAAEMVGMKRVGGKLVPNPNAKWVISETTRAELRGIVTRAFEQETPLDKIVDEIKQAGSFSDSRAQMIARTEVARAATGANFEVWKQTGLVVTKLSQLSADHSEDMDDVCDKCAAQGEIPLDDNFLSGELYPPHHPNCWCVCIAGEIA